MASGKWIVVIGVTIGCGSPVAVSVDASGVTPAPVDAGIMDPPIRMDAGPPRMDAGPPAMDSGPPDETDAGVPLICNPDSGIECDGDWTGRCGDVGCSAEECCSPLHGQFVCVPRNADGVCPASDIWVDEERLRQSVRIDWRYFEEDDCAIVEGCVSGSGWRRLLRFSTWTPNTGEADLFLGAPTDSVDYFEYSACHDHYHFLSYARYRLADGEGDVAAVGHKQAFCLLDFYRYPEEDERGAIYTCSYQGIQVNYQDVYGRGLDCQWVDITDVASGEYDLEIDLNYEQRLLESNYTNNNMAVSVTVPPVEDEIDVTLPCPDGTDGSADRDCGLTGLPVATCMPGTEVAVACSNQCGLGTCTGDPFMRACEEHVGDHCMLRYSLARNDDSGCGDGSCGRGGDCCPGVTFTCPPSGSYRVFWAAFQPGAEATCDVAVRPTPEEPPAPSPE